MPGRGRRTPAVAILALCVLLALPLVSPTVSAARVPAGDWFTIGTRVDASLETPTFSVSAQASGAVELFGVHWDVTGVSAPVFFDLQAVATFSGESDTCSAQLPGIVTSGASVETVQPQVYPASGQIVIDVEMPRTIAHCTLIDMDIGMDFQQHVAHSFGSDAVTGEMIIESRSSSMVSLQVIDSRTGTPLAGRVSSSDLRSRTVVEPSEPDKLGRVKVQFHWDTQQSSTWVRMAQPYSGGSILIPRVGWEVVVGDTFLEGSSERRDELRVESSGTSEDRLEVEFGSQAADVFAFLTENLAKLGNVVRAEGRWMGSVIEGDAGIPGEAAFDDSLQLRDLRHPAIFTPTVDHQRHAVTAPAVAHGEGLATSTPSVRFGTGIDAPAPSPLQLRVLQGSQLDTTGAGWPTFEFRITLSTAVEASRPGSATPAFGLEGTVETTIRGDARSGEASAEIRHRFFAIVDRSSLPPITVERSGVDVVSIDLFPTQQGAPAAHGKINNLKQISLGISDRSNLFAVWTTIGSFRVTEDGFDLSSEGTIEVEGNVDPPDVAEPLSLDLGFHHSMDGRKFKPLFAFYIADLDNRVNLMVGETHVEAQGGFRTPAIFGPGGPMDARSFFDVVVTSPTDRFTVETDSDAVASVQGDAFLVDFRGLTTG